MKVIAARAVRDGEDIRLLLDRLRITTAAGVWGIVARYVPDETITSRCRLLAEDLLNRTSETPNAANMSTRARADGSVAGEGLSPPVNRQRLGTASQAGRLRRDLADVPGRLSGQVVRHGVGP